MCRETKGRVCFVGVLLLGAKFHDDAISSCAASVPAGHRIGPTLEVKESLRRVTIIRVFGVTLNVLEIVVIQNDRDICHRTNENNKQQMTDK